MIALAVGQIIIEAAVLCLILRLIAKHEADYSFAKVAMVTGGMSLGSILIDALLSPHIGRFAILAVLAFIAFMLWTFCWTSFRKTVLVIAFFTAFHVLLATGSAILHEKMNEAVERQMPVTKQDFEDARKFLEDSVGVNLPVAAPVRPPAVSAPAPAAPVPAITSAPPAQAQAARPAPQPAKVNAGAAAKAAVKAKAKPPSGPAATSAAPDAAAAEAARWAEARKQLVVGGVVAGQDGQYVATVNGKLVEKGSVVSTAVGNKVYRWRVRAITRSGIDCDPVPDPSDP